LIGAVLSVALGVRFAQGTTSYFIGEGDAINTSSLTNALNWSIPENFPDPGTDYVAVSKRVRAPKRLDVDFTCHSFQVGEAGGRDGFFSMCSDGQATAVTFGNEGLILAKGEFAQYNNSQGTVNGYVTVTAESSFPVRLGANNQIALPNAALHFTGDVTGEEGTALVFYIKNAPADGGAATNSVYRFTGDLSQCRSTFEFREFNTLSYSDKLKRTTFSAGCDSFGGTLLMNHYTAVEPYQATQDFSVAKLVLKPFSSVALTYDLARNTASVIRVTDTLTVQAPVIVRENGTAGDANAFEFPLLKAPSGMTLNADDFTFDLDGGISPTTPAWYLRVATDPEDGLSTLYVRKNALITLTVNDTASGPVSYAKSGSYTNAWSDGFWPGPGKDYLVANKTMRTPGGTAISTFQGDSLTLKNSGTLNLKFYGARIDDLRVFGKAFIANLGGGTALTNQFAYEPSGGGTMSVEGRIRISTGAQEYLYLQGSRRRYLRIDSELSGYGDLQIRNYLESAEGTTANAFFELAGLNTNLYGKILIKSNTYDASKGVPSFAHHATLFFRDARNLGGNLSSFTYDAVQVMDYAALYPLESVTLNDVNRGVFVNGVGRLIVTNDVVFTVTSRFTYAGECRKEGPGVLALGGDTPKFTGNQSEVSLEGTNLLTIAGGTLKPLSAEAFDGLRMCFSNDTQIALDVPADTTQGLSKYGMLNTKALSFITLPENGVTVTLKNPQGVAEPKGKTDSYAVPICTVSSDAAESLRGKFNVSGSSPWKDYPVKEVKETANADGTVTFGIAFAYAGGLTIVVR
jgi:hypothetical protein